MTSDLESLRVPAGLCATCAHLRLLSSARSVFVRCGRADQDPRWPRYPALPRLACDGFGERQEKSIDPAPEPA